MFGSISNTNSFQMKRTLLFILMHVIIVTIIITLLLKQRPVLVTVNLVILVLGGWSHAGVFSDDVVVRQRWDCVVSGLHQPPSDLRVRVRNATPHHIICGRPSDDVVIHWKSNHTTVNGC